MQFKKIGSFISRNHSLIASLFVIPFQVATFVVFVYRGAATSPFGSTSTFNCFLIVALTIVATFFATLAIARYAISRKARHLAGLADLGVSGDALVYECNLAAQSVNSGIGFCGVALWTMMLALCFVALDLPRWVLFPFSVLYFFGFLACTEGVRVFNRMLNLDIATELGLLVGQTIPNSESKQSGG
jgi:hypothetical protein